MITPSPSDPIFEEGPTHWHCDAMKAQPMAQEEENDADIAKDIIDIFA